MALHNGLSPVGGESPTGSEGRHGQRFRVLLNAELVSTTEEQPVKVRDISGTGAMIEGQRPIAKASDIILRRGTIEIFAQIAWTDGNQGRGRVRRQPVGSGDDGLCPRTGQTRLVRPRTLPTGRRLLGPRHGDGADRGRQG
jgi:hypothetical protein